MKTNYKAEYDDAQCELFMDHEENLPFPAIPLGKINSRGNSEPTRPGSDAREVPEAGPPSDSMGPTKRNSNKSTRGGYDTLELGLYGKWDQARFASLVELLAEKKESAQASPAYAMLNNCEVLVEPKGFRAGCMYQFALAYHGIKIGITEKPSKNYAAIRIRFGFEALIGRNAFELFEALLEWLKGLEFNYEKSLVSRADLQVDMLDVPFRYFLEPIMNDKAVYRARKYAIYGESKGPTSIRLGTNVQICIYDKMAELWSINDIIKWELMKEHRSINPLTDECTRVEFRLRRESLKAMEIDSMEDLKEKQSSLVEFLHTKWFRLLSEPKKKSNTSRQPESELWKEVQSIFDETFAVNDVEQSPICRDWNKRRVIKCEPHELEKQAAGCYASALAMRGEGGVLQNAKEYLSDMSICHSYEIGFKAQQRAKELSVRRGVDFYDAVSTPEKKYSLPCEFESGEEWSGEIY